MLGKQRTTSNTNFAHVASVCQTPRGSSPRHVYVSVGGFQNDSAVHELEPTAYVFPKSVNGTPLAPGQRYRPMASTVPNHPSPNIVQARQSRLRVGIPARTCDALQRLT